MGKSLRLIMDRVWLAHDALHKDDVGTAHAELHLALGLDDEAPGVPSTVKPGTASMHVFDAEFRRICLAHGVRAAYVAVEPDGRALTGGDADVCAELDRQLRARG